MAERTRWQPGPHTYWPYSGFTDLGDCWCTAISDGNTITGVRVEHADPRVLISGDLLAEFHKSMQFGSLTCAGENCPVGDVFRIDGTNRSVVYRVTGRDTRWPKTSPVDYVAEWPD